VIPGPEVLKQILEWPEFQNKVKDLARGEIEKMLKKAMAF
jgi:hypothetical protein